MHLTGYWRVADFRDRSTMTFFKMFFLEIFSGTKRIMIYVDSTILLIL